MLASFCTDKRHTLLTVCLGCGMQTVARDAASGPAAWMSISLLTLAELLQHDRRGRWLHRLRHHGHLQQYVNALATMDRVEAEASMVSAGGWARDGDLAMDATTASGIVAGLPGMSAPRNGAWGEVGIVDGTPLPGADVQNVNVKGLASAFECTLSLLIHVASSPDGCLALTEYGVVSVVSNLRWLRHAIDKAGSLPTEGQAAAMYMQQRHVRLTPVVQLLSAMMSARPNDVRVMEQVCVFLGTALPLCKTLLRMCGPLDAKPSLRIIRLASLVAHCLALAATSDEYERRIGAELDDDVVKVLRKFCVHPRAVVPTPGATVRPSATAEAWWLHVEPLWQDERLAAASDGGASPARQAPTSEFRQRVVEAGESLVLGAVSFCRTRSSVSAGWRGSSNALQPPTVLKPNTMEVLAKAISQSASGLRNAMNQHRSHGRREARRAATVRRLQYVLESCMMLWYLHAKAPVPAARLPDVLRLGKELEHAEQVSPFVHRILRHLRMMSKASLVKGR